MFGLILRSGNYDPDCCEDGSMKISVPSVAAVGFCALLIAVGLGWLSDSDSQAVAYQPPLASTLVVAVPLVTETFEYVGSSKCKMCHIKQHKSWKKTKMGQAFDILMPGKSVEAKVKFNIDPNEDFTQEAACLACHTTGYGQPGGYAIPDSNDKKAVKHAKKMRGVGCESCHGPGSVYAKIHKDIFMSKRNYRVEEMYAAGMTKIEASSCTSCHNDQSPTINVDAPFDFEKMKDEGTHTHFELKYRHGS